VGSARDLIGSGKGSGKCVGKVWCGLLRSGRALVSSGGIWWGRVGSGGVRSGSGKGSGKGVMGSAAVC
jgi:hypothetical protein